MPIYMQPYPFVYFSSPPAPSFLTLVTPAFSPARADIDDLLLFMVGCRRRRRAAAGGKGGNGADNTLELEPIIQRE